MGATDLMKSIEKLPPAERYLLVEQILESLDATDPAIEAAWAVEASERLAAYRLGEMPTGSIDEVMTKYR